MKIFLVLIGILFSVYSYSQNMNYKVVISEKLDNAVLTNTVSVVMTNKVNNNYQLITGEAFGLPKSTQNDILIIDNSEDIVFIAFVDKNGKTQELSVEAIKEISSNVEWDKIVFYNKDKKKLGEQNFNLIFE